LKALTNAPQNSHRNRRQMQFNLGLAYYQLNRYEEAKTALATGRPRTGPTFFS